MWQNKEIAGIQNFAVVLIFASWNWCHGTCLDFDMKGITLKKMLISIILIIKHYHLTLIMHILQTSSIMLLCLHRSIELK